MRYGKYSKDRFITLADIQLGILNCPIDIVQVKFSIHFNVYLLDISHLNIIINVLYVLNKLTIFRTLSAVGHLGLFRASLSVPLFFFFSKSYFGIF